MAPTAAVALIASASGIAATPVADSPAPFDGRFTPRALPKADPAPVSLRVSASGATADGSPPVLREVVVEVDKHIAVEAEGIPTCRPRQLRAVGPREAKRRCGKAIVGSGKIEVWVTFPEAAPIPIRSGVSIFNGGFGGRVATLLVYAYNTHPNPNATVTEVKIRKIHRGRYGSRFSASIPRIAGGLGSTKFFRLTIGKRILAGTCPDGRLQVRGITVFSDGIRAATELGRPCTPKG